MVAACREAKPDLPAKGQVFNDSLYGATLVRISDKAADNYSGNGIQNEYARADAGNADGSYLILRSNDGVFYLYNGTSYALVRSLDELGGGQELEPRWDASNPDVFYYVAGPNLKRFRVSGSSQEVVHDFTVEFPGCSYVSTGVEGDASQDRRYWCFEVSDSLFNLMAVCVYDMETDSVLGRKTTFPDAVNHVTMDASGAHAVIAYDATVPFQSFSRDFSTMVQMPAGALGHADVALTATGRDVVVYQNVQTDFIEMADLETGAATQLLAIPFDVNTDIGLHISGNCYDTPGWVLVSTYGAKNPEPGHSHSWMDNLLFMLELDASPETLKLAQTRCHTGARPGSNYFAEAFASINRAGTKVVFGSNWGILSPEDYTDAYEVRMPAGWNH
jgi:hypothetical protein